MSRITAPASKLSRAIGSSAAASLRDSSARATGAILMPKYAELLRSSDHHDSSRGLTTAHRPTPQPSLANRPKPLMQTFHSTAPSASAAAASTNLDAAIFPSMADLFASSDAGSNAGPRMPLLPDNYSAAHGPTSGDGPVHLPSIIAADPDNVLPATPLSDVEGIGLDGVDLKFAHESQHSHQLHSHEGNSGGMIRDLWKGMVEDVLGPAKK
ncbi:hypothetical protein HRG_009418 [Hirsutella rhossiliensis]|uniref:Uncharacterized protein n=1 Tax=Hirsutella rhossiliensis TaxID=111463 RepID=A0A9P8MSX3_9HYPO|nr:uncharacterized protein HRG_09418 [Hirsutella rhossiliensis]KAH0959636.1 hypothetical protein HRG_09418 [Hirsutella rhossiliensis]